MLSEYKERHAFVEKKDIKTTWPFRVCRPPNGPPLLSLVTSAILRSWSWRKSFKMFRTFVAQRRSSSVFFSGKCRFSLRKWLCMGQLDWWCSRVLVLWGPSESEPICMDKNTRIQDDVISCLAETNVTLDYYNDLKIPVSGMVWNGYVNLPWNVISISWYQLEMSFWHIFTLHHLYQPTSNMSAKPSWLDNQNPFEAAVLSTVKL